MVMRKSRTVSSVAAAVCAGLIGAVSAYGSQTTVDVSDAMDLSSPLYASDTPRKPLMHLLDRAGLAKPLDELGINIGGHIEGGWTYNFDTPDSQINAGRVFDFEDQDLTLHQIDIFVERAVSASSDKFDIGGRIEWIWGGDARLIHSNGLFDHYGLADGPDEQFDPVQAYILANVPVGNGLLLKAGKFVTMHGAETINPTTNPLYSHTYLFGFAIPFTHTGVMATYAFNSNWSASLAVVRGWDQALEDNNDALSYMAQIAYVSEKFDLYTQLCSGPEQFDNEDDWRHVLDVVAVFRATDQITLIGNGDWGWEADAASDGGDATWYGAAGYVIYKINEMFSAVGRLEYFNDDDGARGLATSVIEATAGLNIKPLPNCPWGSGLLIRPEIRWDSADDDIFNDASDDSQFTFGVDAIYAF